MAPTNAQATATVRGRGRGRTTPNRSCTPNNSRAATSQKITQSRQTGGGRSQASASKSKKNPTKGKDVRTEEDSAGLNGTASPGPSGGSGFGGLGDDDYGNDEQPPEIDYNQRQDTDSTNSLAVSRQDADEPPVDWQLIAEDHQNETNRLKQQKLDIERQLRRANEDSEAAHQAFTELQSEVIDLRESLKSLKRKNQEAEDEQEVPQKKQNKKKAAIPHDKFAHADRAGKKFMANYCAFAQKVDIFDGFQQARDAQEWGDENNLNDEENNSNADDDDDNSEGEERAVAGTAGQKSREYDLTKTGERERFARDSAICFFNEVPPKEVEGWEDADYQTRFMDGMSRMQSAFRKHEDARLIFGLPINQEDFGRASRKSIPAVAELLRNSTFMGEAAPESASRVDNAYRHKCLLQICRSILFGKRALVDGTKSAMARDIYAYQWRIKTMNINMIAFAAYISFFILSGEGNLAHASKTSHVYWRHLGLLYKQSIKEDPTFIDELLEFYDKALGLDEDEELEEEDSEQVALLRELEG